MPLSAGRRRCKVIEIDKDNMEDLEPTRDTNNLVVVEPSSESDHTEHSGDRDEGLPPPKKRKVRGITKMLDIIRDRYEGEPKIKVKLNEDGVPIGDSGAKFMSSVGVHVRSIVPINIAKWPQVSDEKKDDVWDALMEEFEVDERIKEMIIGEAGKMWRRFKSTLTAKYIIPFMDHPELLNMPPEKYSFIQEKEWVDFVASRLTPTFLRKRKEAQERAKNIKYHVRLGRRGYANMKEDLRRKKKGGHVGRAILWKVARIPKQGPMDEETKIVVDRIDQITKKVDDGEITSKGRKDVLTLALGSDEHTGRVRGAGRGVTLTKYFGRQRSTMSESSNVRKEKEEEKRDIEDEKHIKEISLLREEVKMAKQAQEVLQSTVTKLLEEIDVLRVAKTINDIVGTNNDYSGSTLDGIDEWHTPTAALHRVSEPNHGLGEGQVCQLALYNRRNIVAHGTAWMSLGPNHVLHGIALGVGNARVVIDIVEEGESLLPIPPIVEMLYVKDAIGTFIAWPRNLIVMSGDEEWIFPRCQLEREVWKDLVPTAQASSSKKDKEVSSKSSAKKVKRGRCDGSQSIQMMRVHAYEVMGPKDTLDVVCPRVVFGNSFFVKLKRNEIVHLCEEERIKANVITVYMRYLHEYIREHNLGGQFFFVSPALLATEMGRADDQIRALAERLEGARENHQVFTPYWDGVHWMLGIICPYAGKIDWLDPSRNAPDERFKRIANMALNLCNSSRGSSVRYTYYTWTTVKCPEQLNTYESGYYVMRYMRDIIHGLNMENYNEVLLHLYVVFDTLSNFFGQKIVGNYEQVDIIGASIAGQPSPFILFRYFDI